MFVSEHTGWMYRRCEERTGSRPKSRISMGQPLLGTGRTVFPLQKLRSLIAPMRAFVG